jgi:hypothetical protein
MQARSYQADTGCANLKRVRRDTFIDEYVAEEPATPQMLRAA